MSRDDLIGKTLGKCRLLERLGHGRTASLFRAFYEPLGKEVAVKILKEDAKATPEIREKFLAEARALARLDHENIVKVFDVVEEAGHLFIVMELLKGRNLLEVLEENGPVEAPRAVEIVGQVARALEAAHAEQIVHRDVKPQNILLTGARGRVKLLDFGLATRGGAAGRAGTPHYMSPEQIQGKHVDEKSDIYSLGATLFHLLTGRPPYKGKTAKEIMERHLEGKLPSVSRANREVSVPSALDPIVKRMMAPVPGYRYSAKDLVAALGELNLASRSRAHHPRAAHAAARRNPRTPLLLAAVGVGALVVILVVVVFVTKKSRPGTAAPPEKAGKTAQEGISPLKPVIPDRASERESRQQAAEQLYDAAKRFEAAHFGKYDEIVAEYKKVWDEYGETSWGQKARDRMREIDRQRTAKQRAEEEAVRMKKQQEGKAALEKTLAATVKSYDFPAAKAAIEGFEKDFGETPELQKQARIFGYASDLLTAVGQAINESETKLKLSYFREGAAAAAVLDSVDPDTGRVKIKEGGLERDEPWSYFTVKEIDRLAQRALSARDPWTWCLLHAFLTATGHPQEAEETLQMGTLQGGRAASAKIDEYRKTLEGK